MSSPRMSLALLAGVLLGAFAPARGFILAVDLGSQYFKSAIMAPGKQFEVVLNAHSKRKTPTAVSFHEKVRSFGDDALAGAVRGAKKTPMFFPLQLGRNLTGVAAEAQAWLPKEFYPYDLAVNASSGSLVFEMGDDSYAVEEAAAHVFDFAAKMAREAADGAKVSDVVITVPSDATFSQRRSLLASAKMAGLPRPQLIHETSAAALHRGLDVQLTGTNGTGNESLVLFYNMGALHSEACIVEYQGATFKVGGVDKPTVAMNVLGCGTTKEMGGHLVDMAIAQKMLRAFQAKHPKLAEGIVKSVRALKKLEKEAMGAKHVLSANKEALFRVESLYEDTDFSHPVTRDDLEEWSKDIFAAFQKPIDEALAIANKTLADIDGVEMVGGGWRIPKVQALVAEHLAAQRPADAPVVQLSQHVNGDEAMATGAAFYAANSSTRMRGKRVYYTDATQHAYTLTLEPLNVSQPHEEGWSKGVELFPAGSKLRQKRTVKTSASFDLRASLYENGNPIVSWDLTGVYEAATGKYAHLPKPLLSLKFEVDGSGLVQLSSATAVFDEEVVVEPPKAAAADSNASADTGDNASSASAGEAAEASGASAEEAAGEGASSEGASGEDGPAEGAPGEGAAEAEAAEGTADAPEGEVPADGAASADTSAAAAANGTGAKKTKIKKRKVSMQMAERFDGVVPRPPNQEEHLRGAERLRDMNAFDDEIRRVEGAKNALEAYIYESRDKLNEDEDCQKVSTEEERSTVSELLTQMEDWLWEDEAREANASTLDEKMRGLQEHMLPIRRRAFEMEQRKTLPELIVQVKDYVNGTLAFVEKNMTWVSASNRESVQNLTIDFEEWWANVTEQQEKLELTQDPAFTVQEVKQKLHTMQTEAHRLTKMRKIDPIPYSSSYGGAGGKGGYDDPKMREYWAEMMKNFSRNGTDGSDWWKNFSSNFSSNFSGWNNSEYMRSYFEHAARNFNRTDGAGASEDASGAGAGDAETDAAGGAGAEGAESAPESSGEGTQGGEGTGEKTEL